ncbi:homoserine O-acetyltransferase [Bacillus sp. NEB1478]|uniref:homoserine O-acetyltransferase MetX n=1 Tax=Bacillus sp. NEB1478 TaxID=3073816 RepID=UPI002872EBC8|nr:homoserine O-acetyltransferase [Bacillus sp. NEB1478]WNB91278.1 homoserine O-acetyltransferase [Bacillus sp. NEB1478]
MTYKNLIEPAREAGKVMLGEFTLESGQLITDLELAFEKVGNSRGPVILLCHALTGNQDAYGTEEDPGWWRGLIGPDSYIDTNLYQVITFNVLGGCSGSTGPASINAGTGRPYQDSFPFITVRDMVRAERYALEGLGIPRLSAVIGGSLGGMQALEWAVQFPYLIEKVFVLAATPHLNDYGIAFNRLAIHAIENDPVYKSGNREEGERLIGLEIARMAGLLTYRQPKLFNDRFQRTIRDGDAEGKSFYQVESYMTYQGEKLTTRFDVDSYLTLLYAMNAHDIGDKLGGWKRAASQIQAEVHAFGYTGDLIYPPEEIEEFVKQTRYGTFYSIETDFGHDGFLVEFDKWGPYIKAALSQESGLKYGTY